MSRFNIDVFASQCGVTPANIRSWQRYGLIKPHVDERGHRFFDIEHCSRVREIVGWLKKGVALSSMLALLNGQQRHYSSGWLEVQKLFFTYCQEQQQAKLRQLIWRHGRETPPAIFIDEVIRPLRTWMRVGKGPDMQMAIAVLDSIIIEYATFILAGGRKRFGGSMCIIAMSLQDSVDIWLESIRYASDGFRVEVLSRPVTLPELGKIKTDHIMIWVDKVLTHRQLKAYGGWVSEGKPVFLIGPAAKNTQQTLDILAGNHSGLDD